VFFVRANLPDRAYDFCMLYLILGAVLFLVLVLVAIARKSGQEGQSSHAHDEDMWKGHSDCCDHDHESDSKEDPA
ncbi:MAG: hypothetical protein RLZZ224_924, partial [Verrucomicrobiota bacterium]|jgi:hypothetical protein